jgi:hypothetical protein
VFSFEELREIIAAVKATGRAKTFLDVSRRALSEDEPFVVMRHDVEFSVGRALAIAEVERSMDYRATFFFQITSNAYNMLSDTSICHARSILEMGHDVGLHFHLNGITDISRISEQISYEAEVFSKALGHHIEIFSIHRPTPDILAENIEASGLVNAYSPRFFTYTEDVVKNPPLVKYISDSKHRWTYGYPDAATLAAADKVQILIHPFSWAIDGKGGGILEVFSVLFDEKHSELVDTVGSEWVRFREVKHMFVKDGHDGLE